MTVKPDNATPLPSSPETFDNPEFGAKETAARPQATPDSLPAAKPGPALSPTQEMKPVDKPNPAPARSGPLFAPTMEMPPVTVRAPGADTPRAPGPATPRTVPLPWVVATGGLAFALGSLLTWGVMRQPRAEPPLAEQLAEPSPRPSPPPAPAPAPAHLAVAEVEVPRPAADHAAAGKSHHPVSSAKAAETAPTASEAVRQYEAGNVAAALTTAKASKATALVEQLTALEKARSTAAAAHAQHDPDAERVALESALKADAAITPKPGIVRAQIRDALAQAHLQLGIRAVNAKQQKAATDHLRTALVFHPNLPEARRQLEALGQKP